MISGMAKKNVCNPFWDTQNHWNTYDEIHWAIHFGILRIIKTLLSIGQSILVSCGLRPSKTTSSVGIFSLLSPWFDRAATFRNMSKPCRDHRVLISKACCVKRKQIFIRNHPDVDINHDESWWIMINHDPPWSIQIIQVFMQWPATLLSQVASFSGEKGTAPHSSWGGFYGKHRSYFPKMYPLVN